ncbi:SDR family NAD(P)-dependent oxidoreductase [Arthrobacter sp. ISL-28]|uniref:SDR family NAD(P)-dependent oxidoreductase n=1 Tax=Arthrobacter sp. ISL-28 TaxID=2819108 RepID=UPI001BE59D40|nr:SDR family oxidoreductase [Arthrobacter sp. ISL-28]MBT2522566.1 SDR family oxidoreductase [Arthrobacter sp. ISL-28]
MNNVALVTGAARGLGEAIARKLHKEGYKVAITGTSAASVQPVADSLDASGESVWAGALDIRKKSDWESVRDILTEKWGGTDILVNNAGRSQVAPLLEITPEQFTANVEINLNGTFLGCQVFGPHFRDRGYGRIINIHSLAGHNGGTATGAHYAASKGGVSTLTKVFAREFAAAGVTVNAVSPGPLDLPVVYETVDPDKLETIKANIPVGRLGDAEFIADTVALLASPGAASVTGACWDINGGLYMR